MAIFRAALRFFALGFVVGTLVAPRPGAETRRMLREKLTIMANQILELAALPPIEPQAIAQDGGETQPQRRTKSARGSGAGENS